jgi:hypothetical protein
MEKVDVKTIMTTAARTILEGYGEAAIRMKKDLIIEFPTSMSVEFGINSSYEIADYNEVSVAKIRVSLPLLRPKDEVTPATEAVKEKEEAKPAKTKSKKES